MARIRTIKPEFFRHEGLFELELETGLPIRLAFAGLWTAADSAGRFKWNPRALKLDCLPYDNLDFSRVLHALVTRGFVVHYVYDNREYGAIPSWLHHQVINNRERASELPPPPETPDDTAILTREARVPDASATREPREGHAASGEGKGKEGKGREREPVVDNTASGVSENKKNTDVEESTSAPGALIKDLHPDELREDTRPGLKPLGPSLGKIMQRMEARRNADKNAQQSTLPGDSADETTRQGVRS